MKVTTPIPAATSDSVARSLGTVMPIEICGTARPSANATSA